MPCVSTPHSCFPVPLASHPAGSVAPVHVVVCGEPAIHLGLPSIRSVVVPPFLGLDQVVPMARGVDQIPTPGPLSFATCPPSAVRSTICPFHSPSIAIARRGCRPPLRASHPHHPFRRDYTYVLAFIVRVASRIAIGHVHGAECDMVRIARDGVEATCERAWWRR